jgi:hypothetical protein
VINGTASDAERQQVQQHLSGCAECSAEADFQGQLQAAVAPTNATVTDPRAAWESFRARLDSEHESGFAGVPSARRPSSSRRGWLPWAAAAVLLQGIVLGALGEVIWGRPSSSRAAMAVSGGPYHTLSDTSATARMPTVRVVFATSMTLAQLRALLADAHLQVVSGPSDSDVWSLAPAEDSTRAATDAAIQRLRENAGVRFAEPIAGAP